MAVVEVAASAVPSAAGPRPSAAVQLSSACAGTAVASGRGLSCVSA